MAYKCLKQLNGCKDNLFWNTDSEDNTSRDNNGSGTNGS